MKNDVKDTSKGTLEETLGNNYPAASDEDLIKLGDNHSVSGDAVKQAMNVYNKIKSNGYLPALKALAITAPIAALGCAGFLSDPTALTYIYSSLSLALCIGSTFTAATLYCE